MNKLANARSRRRFREKTHQHFIWQGTHSSFPVFLGEVYFLKSRKDSFLRENLSLGGNFLRLYKIFLKPGETFLSAFSSIQAQLLTGLLKARSRKNPAVAAAGS
jgi:hypothetical protein